MDQDTREAFDALMGLTTQNKEKTEECLRLLEHQGERITRLEGDNVQLKHQAFGSDPPPAASALGGMNGKQPPPPSVFRKVSEHDDEIGNLAGQVQALRSEMATKEEVGAVKTEVDTIKIISVEQNKTMGIARPEDSTARRFVKFVASRDGRNFIITIVTMVSTMVLAALGYKTATEGKQATADVEKHIQRSEENVVRSMPSAIAAASTSAHAPATSTSATAPASSAARPILPAMPATP